MENPKAKDADRSKVAMAVLDRAGLYATAETRVTMGLENDTETLARIKLLAERNGIPLAQLLGARHAKMIEGAAIDVTPRMTRRIKAGYPLHVSDPTEHGIKK